MAIPSGMTRVVFGGTAPNGEIFQWGFWVQGTASTNVEASALAEDLLQVWLDLDVRLPIQSLIKSDSSYTFVKAYCYPTGGPTATFVGERTITPGGGGGGSGSGNAPLYQCMVVSTRTALSGRTHRGRLYLPASGTTLDTTHRFANPLLGQVADAMKAMFDAVNDFVVPVGLVVSVLSQKDSDSEFVTSISIDSKPDVQRRRENKMAPGLTETRAIAA